MIKNINSFEEYQKLLRAIFYFFDNVCRTHNIKYSACSGTLIGVVRHSDIIPWDGDVDVAMTWDNFNKLAAFFDEYKGRFYLNYLPNHFLKRGKKKDYGIIHARIVDSKCSNPLFCIDVYTIDFLGDNEDIAKKAVKKYRFFYSFAKSSITFHLPPIHKYNSAFQNFRNILIHIFHPFVFLVSWLLIPVFKKTFCNFTEKYLKYDEKSKYYTLKPYYRRMGYSVNNLGNYIDLPFSVFKVMTFDNYDELLRSSYGDYMKIPPKNKQIPYPSFEELVNTTIDYDKELEDLISKSNKQED